jgi:hypothetical protein
LLTLINYFFRLQVTSVILIIPQPRTTSNLILVLILTLFSIFNLSILTHANTFDLKSSLDSSAISSPRPASLIFLSADSVGGSLKLNLNGNQSLLSENYSNLVPGETLKTFDSSQESSLILNPSCFDCVKILELNLKTLKLANSSQNPYLKIEPVDLLQKSESTSPKLKSILSSAIFSPKDLVLSFEDKNDFDYDDLVLVLRTTKATPDTTTPSSDKPPSQDQKPVSNPRDGQVQSKPTSSDPETWANPQTQPDSIPATTKPETRSNQHSATPNPNISNNQNPTSPDSLQAKTQDISALSLNQNPAPSSEVEAFQSSTLKLSNLNDTTLGGVNLYQYCQNKYQLQTSTSTEKAKLKLDGNTVYSWKCTNMGIDLIKACTLKHGNKNISADWDDFNKPFSLYCTKNGQKIAGIDLWNFCTYQYGNKAKLKLDGNTVYSWKCTNMEIDITEACKQQYQTNVGPVLANFNDPSNPYSWQCSLGLRINLRKHSLSVNIPGNGSHNGLQLDLHGNNDTTAQAFVPNNGTLKANNRCLDADGLNIGAKVHLWDCHGRQNQQWQIDNQYRLRIKNSNLCLDSSNYENQGSKLHLWDCHSFYNQKWEIDNGNKNLKPNLGQPLRISTSDKQLDLQGNSISNGTNIQVYSPNDSTAQQWEFSILQNSDKPTGLLIANGKCLDVHKGDDYQNGSKVQLWRCHSTDNQQFQLNPDTKEIRLKNTNYCLDLSQDKIDKVHLWTCHNQDNQKWYGLILEQAPICDFTQNTFCANLYANNNLSNKPFKQINGINPINQDWGKDSPAGAPNDNFSIIYKGNFQISGNTQFTLSSDDGVKLYVDNNLIIDQWNDHPITTYKTTINLSQGNHNIELHYYEKGGYSEVELGWGTIEIEQIRYFVDTIRGNNVYTVRVPRSNLDYIYDNDLGDTITLDDKVNNNRSKGLIGAINGDYKDINGNPEGYNRDKSGKERSGKHKDSRSSLKYTRNLNWEISANSNVSASFAIGAGYKIIQNGNYVFNLKCTKDDAVVSCNKDSGAEKFILNNEPVKVDVNRDYSEGDASNYETGFRTITGQSMIGIANNGDIVLTTCPGYSAKGVERIGCTTEDLANLQITKFSVLEAFRPDGGTEASIYFQGAIKNGRQVAPIYLLPFMKNEIPSALMIYKK